MKAHIARLDLRLRRRVMMGSAVGIVAFAVLVMAVYPLFKNQSSINQLTDNSTISTLSGGGAITTPAGWLNVYIYTYMAPLITILVTINYGAACIGGQDEDRTLGLVAALPLSRRTIAVNKLVALFIQSLVVPIVVALCVLGVGGTFDITLPVSRLVGVTVGVVLLGLFFGALAMLIGAVTGSRGTALGISSAGAAGAYLIGLLAPSINWLRPTRFISPYFYAVGDKQIQHGLPIAYAAILATATLLFAVAAVVAFERLDLR